MDRDSSLIYFMAKTMQFFLTPIAKIRFKGKKVWILSERGYDARDNGYHMFLYLRKQHPEIEAWYLITPDSADLKKVEPYGNIVYYGSLKYWLLFLKSSVSFEAFGPTVPSGNMRFGKDVRRKNHQINIFLQHGIIGNDLPFYHREWTCYDIFICGAKPEYDYVLNNFNYTNGEVRYTGLARFDSLHDIKTKRTILIMPTWRRWFAECDAETFAHSEYFSSWNKIINSPELESISEQYGVDIIFYPHELMQKYLGLFSTSNKKLIIANHHEYDVQTLLKESALLITDYSSVNFDFAYMNKPIIYYQFDTERFFKDHVGKGWFDYRESGFGECVQNEEDLISVLNSYVVNDFQMKPEYVLRVNGVFPLHDDHNCERIYQEIINTYDHDELF